MFDPFELNKHVQNDYRSFQEKVEDCSCEIAVSYLEVYNETIVDLINQSSGALAIRDDGQNAINIPGLSIHKPSGMAIRMTSTNEKDKRIMC